MTELRHFEVQMGVPGSAPSWMMSIDESSESACGCKATGSIACACSPQTFSAPGRQFHGRQFFQGLGAIEGLADASSLFPSLCSLFLS